jgi:IclR family acetate operon transcriptional repressor
MNVKTAGRTLDLFELFARELRPLRLTEVADLMEVPVSSCFQLLKTLEERGYVYALKLKSYYPTKQLLQHAKAIASHDPIAVLLGPALERLRDETGETVILGQRSHKDVMMLEVVESPHLIRFTGHPGAVREMHCSALGKALLGQMTAQERDECLPADPLPKRTSATVTSRSALDAELRRSSKRGWYEVRGESVLELHAVAVPLRVGASRLALCLAGPVTRFAPQREVHAQALLAAAREIEQQYGGLITSGDAT